jgi:hypothetical protein
MPSLSTETISRGSRFQCWNCWRQPKIIERLKDDFIVWEPKDKPQTAASRPAAPIEPAAANPVPEESQRLFIVSQRNTAQAQPQQEQAVLPFNTAL